MVVVVERDGDEVERDDGRGGERCWWRWRDDGRGGCGEMVVEVERDDVGGDI